MPNKHFCQGTHCHTNPTSDRFLKSKGIIRGRYARLNIDYEPQHNWGYVNMDKYFCSQGCANSWLSENMSAIEMGIPVPFIRERRFTKGYEKRTTTHDNYYGNGTYTSSSIQKIGVDNNAD
jgi:hypothetical protein